jgi:hypothetical protein
MVEARQGGTELDSLTYKSLDRSASGSVFLNLVRRRLDVIAAPRQL